MTETHYYICCTHLSDDSEASEDKPNNDSDSDSRESDFNDTDSDWEDLAENNDTISPRSCMDKNMPPPP
jgi:hypothetical protein